MTSINRNKFLVCSCRMFIYKVDGFSLNIKELHLSATFYCDILYLDEKPRHRWKNFQNLEFQNRIHKECVTKNINQLNYSFFLLSKFVAKSSYIYLKSLVISNNMWYLRERRFLLKSQHRGRSLSILSNKPNLCLN